MRPSIRRIIILSLSLPVLSLLPAGPTVAEGLAPGCVAIDHIEAAGGACRAIVRNGCDRAVRATVQFEMESLGFSPNLISSPGLQADHHGEPAYGGYTPPSRETAEEEAALAPGESRTFTRRAGDGGRFMTGCRVRVTAR